MYEVSVKYDALRYGLCPTARTITKCICTEFGILIRIGRKLSEQYAVSMRGKTLTIYGNVSKEQLQAVVDSELSNTILTIL